MLLGGVMGFLFNLAPDVIKMFKEWMDRRHELKMMEFQLKYARELSQIRIEEARELAEIELDKKAYTNVGITEVKPTGSKWADFLQVLGNFYNQSVRPTLTYLICGCWLLVKYAMFQKAGGTLDVLPQIWSGTDSDFVAMVVCYWFGNRDMLRRLRLIK